jgi:hypothetical protein
MENMTAGAQARGLKDAVMGYDAWRHGRPLILSAMIVRAALVARPSVTIHR